MYSLTQTGIHYITPPQNNQPIVKAECKCGRVILQQQVYTCLSCSTYCCHYCTVPQFSSYQCRSCKRISQNSVKNSKCTFCFACPYCQNVLTLTKDPKSKCWIYLCQFCYWSTKQINMKEERTENLQENLYKLSSLRQGEHKIYNTAFTFFKEANMAIEMENQSYKYTQNNKRTSIRSSIEQASHKDKQHLKKINEGMQIIIKHTSLQEDSQEFVGNQSKLPQALPLLTKKIRKCPECMKNLTNIYRPAISNEPNIQLMHKQLKIIQCQRLAPVDDKVKIKFLKNCTIGDKQYKINQEQQIQIKKTIKINASIQNKRKNANIIYSIRVDINQKKK